MDVAALSLRIDSDDLVKASAGLDKFSSSASKAGATAGNTATAGADKMTRGLSRSAQNALAAARSVDRFGGSSARAAAEARLAARGVDAANMQWERASAALAKVAPAANQATTGIKRATMAANDNARAMKANTGNIAAQFQDVGITAAMGMNPLMIGLQQGTQLSAVFAQSGASMGQVLAGAFRQIASAQAIMTIGLVAAGAALFQLVDWAALGQSAMNGLADVMVTIAPYAVAAAAALALIYSPAIISGIATLTKGFVGLAASMLATLPIPVLIVAGLTAIIAAANYWRDDLTRILGVDIVAAAKGGINFIIGGFVGAYNTIIKVWQNLPEALGDAAYTAANRVKRELNDLFKIRDTETGKTRSLFNFETSENPYAGALREVGGIAQGTMAAAQNVDYVGNGVAAVRDLAGQAADKFREWARALGASDSEKDKGSTGQTAAEKLADILRTAQAEITAQENRLKAVGMSARATTELEQRTKLLNQAEQAGIPITAGLRSEIDRLAKAYADAKIAADVAEVIQGVTDSIDQQKRAIADDVALIGLYGDALNRARIEQELLNAARDALPRGEKLPPEAAAAIRAGANDVARAQADRDRLQRMEKLRKASEDAAFAMDLERGAIGLTGAAALEYAFIAERLNEAKRQGIELSPPEVAAIEAAGKAYAEQRKAIDQLREIESIKARGLDALNNGLVDAIMGAKSLGSVFKSVANQIIADLLRIVIRQILVNTLMKAFGNGFANGGAFGSGGSSFGFADGGTFGTAQRFAKGGAFTNSVVSTPTLFRFANGAKLGEMGEAGPEAIMPLSRDGSGRLGVKANGGGGSKPPEINVTNEYHLAGAIMPEAIVAMIRQGNEQTEQHIKDNLTRYLTELDMDGTPSRG